MGSHGRVDVCMASSHLLLCMMEPLASPQLLLTSSGAACMALAVALHHDSNDHGSEQGSVSMLDYPSNAEVPTGLGSLAPVQRCCCPHRFHPITHLNWEELYFWKTQEKERVSGGRLAKWHLSAWSDLHISVPHTRKARLLLSWASAIWGGPGWTKGTDISLLLVF